MLTLIDKDDGAEDLLPEEVVGNHVRLHHLEDLKSKFGYLLKLRAVLCGP